MEDGTRRQGRQTADGGSSDRRRGEQERWTAGGRWEQEPRRSAGAGAAMGNGREQQGRRAAGAAGGAPEESRPAALGVWEGQGFAGGAGVTSVRERRN